MTTCNYKEVPTVDSGYELECAAAPCDQQNGKQQPGHSNKHYKQLFLGIN